MSPLSVQQRRVLATEGVRYVGVDAASRPVVEQESGIPRQLRRWAITRAGDPTDIRGEVRTGG